MLLKVFKTGLIFLLAILIVFLQFSFIPSLPQSFQAINLPLILILLSLIFSGPHSSLLLALFFGFFLDSWHFYFFATYLLSFVGVVLSAQLILKNWLTDRSLFSFLALTAISSFSYNIIWNFLNFIFSLNGSNDSRFFLFSFGFLKQLFFSIFWSVLFCGLLFIFLSLVSHRLKPVFLKRR